MMHPIWFLQNYEQKNILDITCICMSYILLAYLRNQVLISMFLIIFQKGYGFCSPHILPPGEPGNEFAGRFDIFLVARFGFLQ